LRDDEDDDDDGAAVHRILWNRVRSGSTEQNLATTPNLKRPTNGGNRLAKYQNDMLTGIAVYTTVGEWLAQIMFLYTPKTLPSRPRAITKPMSAPNGSGTHVQWSPHGSDGGTERNALESNPRHNTCQEQTLHVKSSTSCLRGLKLIFCIPYGHNYIIDTNT
jgi:hypothetical protein